MSEIYSGKGKKDDFFLRHDKVRSGFGEQSIFNTFWHQTVASYMEKNKKTTYWSHQQGACEQIVR
tara:strand:+ start:2036 stop:2230 length:195 start_codon:yes stop_codon:yes gene_type:complete